MSIAKTLLKGSFLRVIETIVAIAVGFFLLPFMVQQLGTELYGIWILIGSITASLYLFDFGFATAVTRYVAGYIGTQEHNKVNQVISSSLIIYSALALLICIITVIISLISPYWVENTEFESTIQLLILITGFSIAIEFPFKAFAGIATGYLRYDLLSISRIIVKLLNAGLTIYVLINTKNLILVALVNLLTSIISNIIFFLISKYLFKQLSIRPKHISKQTIKSLFNYSSWAFLIDITRLLKERSAIYFIAAILNPSILTVYYTALRLVEYAIQLLTQATNITTPLFSRYHANNDFKELREKLTIFTRINFVFASFTICFFFLLGFDLIELWMGKDFDNPTASRILNIAIAGKLVTVITSPVSSAIMAMGKPRYLAQMGIFEAALALLLTYIFLVHLDMGATGAAIGMTIPFYLTRPLLMVSFACKKIDMPLRSYYRPLLAPLVFLSVFISLADFIISHINLSNELLNFLLIASGLSLAFWLLAPFIMTKDEKLVVQDLLPGKLKKVIGLYL